LDDQQCSRQPHKVTFYKASAVSKQSTVGSDVNQVLRQPVIVASNSEAGSILDCAGEVSHKTDKIEQSCDNLHHAPSLRKAYGDERDGCEDDSYNGERKWKIDGAKSAKACRPDLMVEPCEDASEDYGENQLEASDSPYEVLGDPGMAGHFDDSIDIL